MRRIGRALLNKQNLLTGVWKAENRWKNDD